jgi:lipopolysaccharide export LptBFGC system permease protein LptF
MNLWLNFLFKRLFVHFTWIFFSICFFFCLLHYATTFSLSRTPSDLSGMFRDYLLFLTNEAPFLITISGLITSIITTFQIVNQRELLSMTINGYSLKKSCIPYLGFSLFCVVSIFFAQNFLSPTLENRLSTNESKRKNLIICLEIPKSGHLICHQKSHSEELTDLYWIENEQRVHYIEILKLNQKKPVATHLFTLEKNSQEQWELVEKKSNVVLPFSTLSKDLVSSLLTPRQQTLPLLLKNIQTISSKKYLYASHFAYRILTMVVAISFILLPFFYFSNFSRVYPWYLFFIGSILFLIFFRVVCDALLILSSLPTFIPSLLLLTLGAFMLIITLFKYARL